MQEEVNNDGRKARARRVIPRSTEALRGVTAAVRTLASRLARKALLKRFCPEGSHILQIEDDLIEMARSKFQEAVLKAVSRDEIQALRPRLEAAIRAAAEEKISTYDQDPHVRAELVEEVCSEPMENILPPVLQ